MANNNNNPTTIFNYNQTDTNNIINISSNSYRSDSTVSDTYSEPYIDNEYQQQLQPADMNNNNNHQSIWSSIFCCCIDNNSNNKHRPRRTRSILAHRAHTAQIIGGSSVIGHGLYEKNPVIYGEPANNTDALAEALLHSTDSADNSVDSYNPRESRLLVD